MRKKCQHGAKRTLAVLTAAALMASGLGVSGLPAEAAKVKVKKLSVKASSKTLYVGKYSPYKTTKLKVKVTPAKAGQKVKFQSLSKKTAVVNKAGKVTAKKTGTAKIAVTTTAKNAKGKRLKKIITIKVKKYKAPTGLSASISKDTLQAGETAQIEAVLSGNPTCKTLVYTSANEQTVTVDDQGEVTAVAAGTADITVSSKVKGNKGKVLKKTFTVTVTADAAAPAASGTPAGSASPSATSINGTGAPSGTNAPSGTDPAQGTDTPSGTNPAQGTDTPSRTNPAQGTDTPAKTSAPPSTSAVPSESPNPTPAPEVGETAQVAPVTIGTLTYLSTEQADIKPDSTALNTTNTLSMSDSNDGMTVSITAKIDSLNANANTYLWNTSGTDAYPMAYQAVTTSGQLYCELDWRSQFYTEENFIPIGKEFTLVTVYTNKEIRIYLDGELKAYYNADSGYSMGGSFTGNSNTALCPLKTTGYGATVRASWTQYQLGVPPKCIAVSAPTLTGEVREFAIYKKALQPEPATAGETLIYPQTATYEISPDSDMVDFGAVLLNASEGTTVTYTSSDKSIAGFTADGKFRMLKGGQVTVTAETSTGVTAECKVTINYASIALHDPSVYQDPVSGYYYTFGSHCLAGYSKDMKSWALVANSGTGYSAANKLFTKSYQQEFAEVYEYVNPGTTNPEGVWAPDIYYSEQAGKYFMYVTIASGGAQGKCAIALATADKPEGPYAYQKMIVASAIESDDVDKTNLMDVLDVSAASDVPAKYTSNDRTYPDCIDATVLEDHNGKLWMVYGSFTCYGGIRMIQLDPATGDRLEAGTYEDTGDDSTIGDKDPYYGIRLANSNGEGPYVMEVPSEKSSTGYYYFLWTSVGGLQSYGGYNMRMYRSENIEGPYKDTAGNAAVSSLGRAELGLRVMDNYKFSFMDYAFTSCGGNSAITSSTEISSEESGKMFLHYHQKWANGTEGFVTKSNQMFLNEDGWLVTAPFAYDGETRKTTYTKEDVAGEYEFVLHRSTYKKTGTDNYDYSESIAVTLNADGTVSGKYTGTWTYEDNYLTITAGGKTYKGVVLEQTLEDTDRTKAMVFTAVGDGNIQSVWGVKMTKGAAYYADLEQKLLEVPTGEISSNFTVPTESSRYGFTIAWTSDNTGAVSFDGGTATVKTTDEAQSVKITATLKKGDFEKSYDWTIQIAAFSLTVNTIVASDTIVLPTESQGKSISWTSSDTSIINPETGVVTRKENEDQTVTLTASINGTPTSYLMTVKKKTALYTQDYSDVTDASSVFSSTSLSGGISIAEEDDNKFLQFAQDASSGNRGGMGTFDASLNSLTNYVVEFDLAVRSGNVANRSASQVVLASKDSDAAKGNNNGVTTGYVFKLSAGPSSEEWTINDSTEKVTITKDTWVHIKTYVCADGTVHVEITKDDTTLYSGAVTANGNKQLNALYILSGRGNGLTKIDNIKVY